VTGAVAISVVALPIPPVAVPPGLRPGPARITAAARPDHGPDPPDLAGRGGGLTEFAAKDGLPERVRLAW
jgi:hypothetical protein